MGYALTFDGVDDYVDLGFAPITSYPFTMEGVFEVYSETAILFHTVSNATPSDQSLFFGLDGQKAKFAIYTSDGYIGFTGSTIFPIGSKVHVAAVCVSNTERYLYVNGVQEHSSTDFYSIPTGLDTGTLGALVRNNGEVSYVYQGTVQGEVRFWSIARTQQQIQDNMDAELTGAETGLVALYKLNEGSNTTIYDSAGANDGTIYGATWESIFLVSGTVTDSNGDPAARTVRVYDRATGALVGETTSDATTGAYEIGTSTTDLVTVIFYDVNNPPTRNAIIYDGVAPV